ncbi:ATP-grasp domain-containing protein [Propionibacteriaceae bacterium Y1685]|uniref:ATP-grasp domain-containing protein n=1 Tax=Microlunatus sp. Y1700 TaxID=3418487 RepID=UPI003B787AE2
MTKRHHLIGLLLGAEEDWPTAFETLVRRLGSLQYKGNEHVLDTERLHIAPFNLRDGARTDVVIDRLAYWYYHPREWLKKVALMDDVYLLNSPFTFQSMEKHSAYCALMRLGMNVPDTVLVPYKNPIDNTRWAYTSTNYNDPFDLGEIATEMGYPMFMKPFDGGAWRGVSRINNENDLWEAYNGSGEMLMHLQKAVDPYDVFARALTIGPETMVMHFRPDEPMHDRYVVDHDFLAPEVGQEAVTVAQTVNALFRWEFNSCEMLVRGRTVHPIDYANACPDVAVTSLHYYFPWAISRLLKWSAFCAVTERKARLHVDTDPWFAIADDESLDHQQRLAGYQRLADEHFQSDLYHQFVAEAMPDLDAMVYEWVTSKEFTTLLEDTITSTYPEHERDRFRSHFRGLMDLWIADSAPVGTSQA